MIKIKNTKVYGMNETVIRSGYPMRTGEPIDMYDLEGNMKQESFDRLSKLGNTPLGSGHSNALKGVIVQFDIKYPQYWTPQFQRYHFADIVSSQSKMYRLTKMDVMSCCNKYVDGCVIDNLIEWINIYNNWKKDIVFVKGFNDYYYLDKNDDSFNHTFGDFFTKYEVFMKIISNTPMGLEMWMGVTTNYLQLRTIYMQRNGHKLKEDWGKFCAWCESLDNFVEFCLKGERKFTDSKGEPIDSMYDWRV